jgi:undecaprenyl-diphosphatase
MDFVQAIILGIVQGIAEWLPISSSAHLAIMGRIIDAAPDLFYYVILHLATLLSLVLFLRKDIFGYFVENNKGMTKKGKYVLIAVVPVFVAGFFLHNFIEMLFTDFFYIGIALIVNGVILFSTKFFSGNHELNSKNSLFVGIMQIFALVPGISRSGITISSGIVAKIKKEEVIMFSLMLSLPAIAGAFAYKLLTTPIVLTMPMMAGFIVSLIVGYFCVGMLINSIKSGKFSSYWSYCVVLGLILLFN